MTDNTNHNPEDAMSFPDQKKMTEAELDSRYAAMTEDEKDSYIAFSIGGNPARCVAPPLMSIAERESHDEEGTEW